MLGLRLNKLAAAITSVYHFRSLFGGGASGYSFSPYPTEKYRQTYGEPATAATAAGDPIGAMQSAHSASGSILYQSTSGNRPVLGRFPKTGIRNLFTYTDTFSNAVWVPTAGSISGRTYTVDGTTATHPMHQSHSVISGKTYTYSIDVETTSYSYVALGLNSATFFGNTAVCYFRLSDSTVFVQPAYYTAASIEQVSTNRWRISVTGPCISSGTTTGIRVYPAVSTDGGATATVTFNGTTYPGTLNYYNAQLEFGSTKTAYQDVTSSADITETGVGSNQLPLYDGVSDFVTLGAQAYGTATLCALSTNAFSGFIVVRTLTKNITIGPCQASATGANRSLQFYPHATTGQLSVISRGTTTDLTTAELTDGNFHVVGYRWDGATFSVWVDRLAAQTVTVGTAAQEAENITVGARTESSTAQFLPGHQEVIFIDRALTAGEMASTMSSLNAIYRAGL